MARRTKAKATSKPPGGKDDGFQLTPTLGEPNEAEPKAEVETKRGTRKSKAKEARPSPAPGPSSSGDYWPAPLHTELECPACGAKVFLDHLKDGTDLWLERQRRIVVFAGPYTEHSYTDPDTGEEAVAQLPEDPMVLWEEATHNLVLGRPANEAEREHFKANKSLDGLVPWTIGHEGHLKVCPRWDRWLSGAAGLRRASLDLTRDGRSYYRLSIPKAEAMAREGVTS